MSVTHHNLNAGTMVHYFDGSGNPCHTAVIQGDALVDEYIVGDYVITADLIQLDSISLGVVVPTIRTAVNNDPNCTNNPSFHTRDYCNRG